MENILLIIGDTQTDRCYEHTPLDRVKLFFWVRVAGVPTVLMKGLIWYHVLATCVPHRSRFFA